jgi:hypothetical protein
LLSHVRQVSFKEDKNKLGNYFVLLPAYKADSRGQGVWFKVVYVRNNFGIDGYESFASKQGDPITYFENQVKLHFPNYAKVEKVTIGGKERKKYPTYGRVSPKVMYNVAYVNELHLGAHVLVVPEHYVGQTIFGWGNTVGSDGQKRPMLNDHKSAIPFKLQLRTDAQGQPWLIEIEANKRYALPEQIANSEYLYNLDEVVHYPTEDELVTKLRQITPSEIFDACMKGYWKKETFPSVAIPNATVSVTPLVATSAVPAPAGPTVITPSFTMPKAAAATNIAPVSVAPTAAPAAVPTTGKLMDIQSALDYLKQKP